MNTPGTPTLGLALGGGGSRAFAHLGVLSVLAEEKIPVTAITGSSMGAILGALYAFNPNATAIREQAMAYFEGSKLFGMNPKPSKDDGLRPTVTLWGAMKKYMRTIGIAHVIAARRGLLKRNIAHAAIDDLLPKQAIEDACIPFACVALNLTLGTLDTFTQGPLRQACKAGTAIGVVYRPYKFYDEEFADAAPVCAVPIDACRALGASRVLAIDIRTPKPATMAMQNGFDVISRIEMIQSSRLNDNECAKADLLLQPDVGSMFWGDFTRLDAMIAAGESAMRNALPQLREILDQ